MWSSEIDELFELVYKMKIYCFRSKKDKTAASVRYFINLEPTSLSRVGRGEPVYSLNRMLAEKFSERVKIRRIPPPSVGHLCQSSE